MALWIAGLIWEKPRGSLRKYAPKGYVLFLSADRAMDGSRSPWAPAVAGGWPGQSLPRRRTMGTAAKLAGALGFANPCTKSDAKAKGR